MTRQCTDAGLSRKQKVYARIEDQPGRLVFPFSLDAIRPAGDATMSQVPTYTDSKEKFDTLDLLDKFPNAMPPGEWSISQYVRLNGFGRAPQGEAFFEATMGRKGKAFSAVLANDISNTVTSLQVKEVTGDVSLVGVIKIGGESIRYGGYDQDTKTFRNCVRGYDDTVAAPHSADDPAAMLSTVYLFDTCAPSMSLWIQTDHLIQFMTGCVVDELKVPVQNEDGVLLSFKGKGMRMGWVGETRVKAPAMVDATEITVDDTKRFSVGGRIYNRTKNDFGLEGYEIVDANHAAGTLTISDGSNSGIMESWTAGDEIAGYLPPAVVSGDAVESRDTVLVLGGVPGKIKKTELTVGVPKEFADGEVGTEFPEEYAGTERSISMNLDCVLRKAAVDKFHEGYNGQETEVAITMGRTPGKKVSFVLPRVKPSVPAVQFDGPTLGLQISATALGKVTETQVGENSLYIIFE